MLVYEGSGCFEYVIVGLFWCKEVNGQCMFYFFDGQNDIFILVGQLFFDYFVDIDNFYGVIFINLLFLCYNVLINSDMQIFQC